jgi:hypothetical protein
MSTRLIQPHEVTIRTRYGDTERDCYCTVTNGMSHDEHDFPWLVEADLKDEKPLDVPMREGEGVDDYFRRLARAEAWTEGWMHRVTSSTAPEHLEAELALAALSGEAENPYL